MRALLVALLLVVPGFAAAADEDPAALALQARAAHEQHCAAANSGDAGLTAAALGPVSGTWVRLRNARTTEAPYLLYWSGLLAQCLNQPVAAREDLEVFVGALQGDPAYSTMVEDAERRLRQLGAERDRRVDLLAVVKEAWEQRCRDRRGELSPEGLQKLSSLWQSLLAETEGQPPDRRWLWRGRLAYCLGQAELGQADLLVLARGRKLPGVGRGVAEDARQELMQQGVGVSRAGELIEGDRAKRRRFVWDHHGEFWVSGGLALGGVREDSRVYAGTLLESGVLADSSAWWVQIDGPAVGGWAETTPEPGVAPSLAGGLRLWRRHRDVAGPAQFGFGLFVAVRRVPGTTTGHRGAAELQCLSRNEFGNCESSRIDGLDLAVDELEALADHRLALGPEFSLRLLPDRLVSPTLHFVVPAIDAPLNRPRVWCAAGEETPSGELDRSKWTDVAVGDWTEQQLTDPTGGGEQTLVPGAPSPASTRSRPARRWGRPARWRRGRRRS
jgi:hypothetical protein